MPSLSLCITICWKLHCASTIPEHACLRSERWEAWLPFTGGALTAAVFITLPTYFYLGRLPHMGDCGEDMSPL